MRLAASTPAHQHVTVQQLQDQIKALQAENQALVGPHHSLVGQWAYDVLNFASTWLPLLFALVLIVTAYLLWKLAGSMPRTKPQNMATQGSSTTTWDDVAGVEEVRAELEEVVEFFRDPKRFERLGAKVPKGLLLYGPP